jgi:gas vesicle protein
MKEKKTNKVGDLVKQSIEEFRDELEQEKEKLKNEFFDPDE